MDSPVASKADGLDPMRDTDNLAGTYSTTPLSMSVKRIRSDPPALYLLDTHP
jgi:hypothetical protein